MLGQCLVRHLILFLAIIEWDMFATLNHYDEQSLMQFLASKLAVFCFGQSNFLFAYPTIH
jgi:hypothetical protein